MAVICFVPVISNTAFVASSFLDALFIIVVTESSPTLTPVVCPNTSFTTILFTPGDNVISCVISFGLPATAIITGVPSAS